MTEAAIEWRATNLVALGEELRNKISRVTQQFEERGVDRAKSGRGQQAAPQVDPARGLDPGELPLPARAHDGRAGE